MTPTGRSWVMSCETPVIVATISVQRHACIGLHIHCFWLQIRFTLISHKCTCILLLSQREIDMSLVISIDASYICWTYLCAYNHPSKRKIVSYTLSRDNRVVKNRYLRLLFTSEDRFCANLHVQKQSTNMTSQCQYPKFAWRQRSTVVTSHYWVRKNCPRQQWQNQQLHNCCSVLCVQDIKYRSKNKIIHSPLITILGHSWCDLPMIFTLDFVTRENHWQIASLVTQKSLSTVSHALFFMSWTNGLGDSHIYSMKHRTSIPDNCWSLHAKCMPSTYICNESRYFSYATQSRSRIVPRLEYIVIQ